jgi:hypothetical protein
VLRELAGVRAAGLARLDSAGDAVQQATAIATIAAAYGRAAGQVAAISGSPLRLQMLLADLASSYQSLAAAARARSVSAYQRLRDRIDSDEQQLRSAATSL